MGVLVLLRVEGLEVPQLELFTGELERFGNVVGFLEGHNPQEIMVLEIVELLLDVLQGSWDSFLDCRDC